MTASIANAAAHTKALATTPPPESTSQSIMVRLAARPTDMVQLERMPRGAGRKAAVWNSLAATAADSQKPFRELADKLKAEGAITGYETLVSPNMLVIDPASGKSGDVLKAFQVPGVKTIYSVSGLAVWPVAAAEAEKGVKAITAEPTWGLDVARRGVTTDEPTTPYGISMVGAPDAWKLGATGKGMVFGSIDTGADYTHEAIAGAYRGRSADGGFDHDYNWMDWGSSPAPEPRDPDAHGTHTIGTVLGKAPTASIGVAPEAKWISAHGLTGAADVRLKSLQWMQAPTKRDGSTPDATRAPDVVGMSWWTAANYQDLFHDSVRNLNSAGIEVVKSAGNKGPGPETISSPGQFKEINAVAAVDSTGQVADFSSRGPSPLPHAGKSPEWKPDFAAPGVDVLSSVPGNRYAKYSGTSMAQPHFSGVVLALLSKYPQLTHDQVVKVLATTANDVGARGRDLEFGYGILNLPAALAAAEKLVGGTKPPAS